MALVSGPELEEIRRELAEWAANTRQFLIEQFSAGHPYGSVKKSPQEQLMDYRAMQDADWIQMAHQLEDLYRGLPDRDERVQADLRLYRKRMEALDQKLQARQPAEVL